MGTSGNWSVISCLARNSFLTTKFWLIHKKYVLYFDSESSKENKCLYLIKFKIEQQKGQSFQAKFRVQVSKLGLILENEWL